MNKILVVVVVLILAFICVSLYSDSKEEIKDNSIFIAEEKEMTDKPIVDVNKEGVVENKENILDFSGQDLTKVPSSIFENTNLEELNLSNNKLDGALPAEVHLLEKLRVLDLSNNNFTGVPAEVGQLVNLEELNLSNNKLTGLPLELGNLKNIQRIDLRGNAYAKSDLEVIKAKLPNSVLILVD